jgi:hypothetical protein
VRVRSECDHLALGMTEAPQATAADRLAGPCPLGETRRTTVYEGQVLGKYPSFKVSILGLSALMDLYIHPLYVLISKILSSILNSSALIHLLYHPLSTLSTVGPTCHFI